MTSTVTGIATEYPSPRGKATNGSGEGRRSRAMRKLAHAIYSVAKNRRPFELRLAAVSEAA